MGSCNRSRKDKNNTFNARLRSQLFFLFFLVVNVQWSRLRRGHSVKQTATVTGAEVEGAGGRKVGGWNWWKVKWAEGKSGVKKKKKAQKLVPARVSAWPTYGHFRTFWLSWWQRHLKSLNWKRNPTNLFYQASADLLRLPFVLLSVPSSIFGSREALRYWSRWTCPFRCFPISGSANVTLLY